MFKKLYIIRHGLTSMCQEPKYPNQNRDVYLSQEGIQQMENVSNYLGNHNLDYIYTSNFKRTLQSSEIILKYQKNKNCKIIIDNRLSNKDDLNNFKSNIVSFLEELFQNNDKLFISIITHGRILKLIYYYLKNDFFPLDIPKLKWCNYGSLTLVESTFIENSNHEKKKYKHVFHYLGKEF